MDEIQQVAYLFKQRFQRHDCPVLYVTFAKTCSPVGRINDRLFREFNEEEKKQRERERMRERKVERKRAVKLTGTVKFSIPSRSIRFDRAASVAQLAIRLT